LLSLRCKYNDLCASKPPIGDPNIPGNVQRALDISQDIIQSISTIVMADKSTERENDFVEYTHASPPHNTPPRNIPPCNNTALSNTAPGTAHLTGPAHRTSPVTA